MRKLKPFTEIGIAPGGNGKQVIISAPRGLPSADKIRPVSQAIGKPLPVVALHERPDFSGMCAIFTDNLRVIEGEDNAPYILIEAYIYPPGTKPTNDDVYLIVVGKDNVFNKIMVAHLGSVLPVSGALRRVGRMWFFD